uniref:Uncharacterized protein n=1 Tax=Meloidogyne enterolobii TaxID=390850 RepID=A0A6V7XQX7_MELEN|nr:unnamed protein product [Meloidogyne enterolobii]
MNVTTPIIEQPKVEELIVDDKENLIPEKEDLYEEFTKIGDELTSKNINENNKIEIFFEEKGEGPQNFREVNNFGEVNNKEKKEIINLPTIPNNQNNGEILGNLANNNGQSSSSNSDNNGGDGDPKNESKIRDLKEPVNNQNNGEVWGICLIIMDNLLLLILTTMEGMVILKRRNMNLKLRICKRL